MRLLLTLVATLAVVLVACGGGGDDNESSPTATTSAAGEPAATIAPGSATATAPTSGAVEDRAEVEALLKATALRLEDLPEGFSLDEESFTTNEESAGDAGAIGEPTLEDLNRFGRILGYDASYSQGGPSSLLDRGTLSLFATATLYGDSDGADQAFEFVRDQASDPDFVDAFEESLTSPGVEIQDASISPMSFAELGDERQAYEVKVSAHSTDLDQDFDFIAQLVGIRRDRLVGAVTVLAINSLSPEPGLEDLARTLDERMKDALE